MTAMATVIDSRYRLGQLVGRGGMSDVYRAVDELTGAEVAVKVVRSGDPVLSQRLAREARALRSVDHPNLVRLLDAGLVDSQAYLVMTYVDGLPLDVRLRGGPFSPKTTAALGAAVADGLAYIHAHGIVHRDVKPANILMTARGQVCLADFGVARMADASSLTVAGTTLGTVAYMAPEQLENHQVGPAADVWSLGIVLVECLTGRRLYTGAAAEVIARRLAEPVPVPAALPEPWKALLAQMLARAPEQRPDAQAVAARLRTPELAAPWDPWGDPLGTPATDTAPLASAPEPTRRLERATTGSPGPASRLSPWLRRAALTGVLAVAAVTLVALGFASGDSAGPKHPAAGTKTSTTARPAPAGAAPELATLVSHVNAGVASGSLTRDTGEAVLGDARRALSDAGAGNRGAAATDLQRAESALSTAVAHGSGTATEADQLEGELSALASTLGVGAVSAPPVTRASAPASVAPAAPPRGHRHGGGKGD
jgi:hypothetical protein